MADVPAAAPFTITAAEAAMAVACQAAGLDARGARLIRLGENALFRLPAAGVVVRVARGMSYWADAGREVAVSRWLAGQKIPAARAARGVDQPVKADGRPVTFWETIEGRDGDQGDIGALADILRRLHQLPPPDGFTLPSEDPLGRVRGRLQAAALPDADRDFLEARLTDIRARLSRLRFPLPPGPVHGDAHVGNLMVTATGPVLIDFERFAWGHPEWDLSMTATEYHTAGWWTAAEYAQFADAYGFDVTGWDGYPLLRAAHELKMTTWLAQNLGESPDAAREYTARMRTLRGQDPPGGWRGF